MKQYTQQSVCSFTTMQYTNIFVIFSDANGFRKHFLFHGVDQLKQMVFSILC